MLTVFDYLKPVELRLVGTFWQYSQSLHSHTQDRAVDDCSVQDYASSPTKIAEYVCIKNDFLHMHRFR